MGIWAGPISLSCHEQSIKEHGWTSMSMKHKVLCTHSPRNRTTVFHGVFVCSFLRNPHTGFQRVGVFKNYYSVCWTRAAHSQSAHCVLPFWEVVPHSFISTHSCWVSWFFTDSLGLIVTSPPVFVVLFQEHFLDSSSDSFNLSSTLAVTSSPSRNFLACGDSLSPCGLHLFLVLLHLLKTHWENTLEFISSAPPVPCMMSLSSSSLCHARSFDAVLPCCDKH